MGVLTVHEQTISRGPTPELWRNFPVANIFHNRDLDAGYGIEDDFVSHCFAVDAAAATVLYGSNGMYCYIDTGCTVSILGAAGGITGINGILRVYHDNTDNDTAVAQYGSLTGCPFAFSLTPGNVGDLIFECRMKTSSITDDVVAFFAGLGEEGFPADSWKVNDTGAMADKDFIGFDVVHENGGATNANSLLNWIYKKNGQAQQTKKAAILTLVADTWYKLGFKYSHGAQEIVPWVNGVEDTTDKVTTANLAAATFPNEQGMNALFGAHAGVATAGQIDIDWVRVGQLSV